MNWYLSISLFILYIFSNAYIDSLRIVQDIDLNHYWEGLKQITIILLFALFTEKFKGQGWIAFSTKLFLFLSLFWLTFDYTLNFIRRVKWWHLGDAITDQILKGYNLRYYRLGLKISIVCIAVLSKIYL